MIKYAALSQLNLQIETELELCTEKTFDLRTFEMRCQIIACNIRIDPDNLLNKDK